MLHQFEEADFEVQTTVADWLHIRGISHHEYVRKIKRWSEYMVMTDATVVLLISGFLSMKAMDISELLDDSTYLEQFKHPLEVQDHCILIPQVLNRPVQDIGAHLEEIGMHACGTRVPLHHILACLLECTPETLCQQLWQWVLHYSSDVHMIEKWLALRGLELAEYLSHLQTEKDSDGLELWLVSLASGRPINVVMEDHVFSTSMSGLDFDFPMIMLLPDCEGLLCKLDVLDDQPAATVPPLASVNLIKGSLPFWRPNRKQRTLSRNSDTGEKEPRLRSSVDIRIFYSSS